eukprot:CAMPEP_0201928006 /NCGR_PEP_ID=MMETSP0903-20130614/19947_1 /ASSEMBLY_ACC=CAM_ASM_000552 /TAXON_ID=420261 /ORGANISM="Thalassiosira antarctica, Strain CCMP982" /LENGTH=680 /DNA_ID=CAMNT_0048466351 /DNA_START=223 /DNA_END=2265 /DNA_ORIENTATION=-
MPNWEGIEDTATMLPRIWLTRAKDGDVWKPLRKIDCKALNESRGEEILIDGGRSTADPKNGTIRFNFVDRPATKLMAATWFTKEEKKNQKEFTLQPLPELDSWQVELLYQNAMSASSSLGEGLEDILKEEIVLESEPMYKVCVIKNGGLLCMKKRPRKSNFLGIGEVQYSLQRGYGQYTIEGEDDENALGDLTHAVFVIHGIGETMWSKEDSSVLSTNQELDQLRMTVNRKKVVAWREECKKCEKQKQPFPPPPNRIEFLPIEWYDKVRSPTHSLVTSLTAVTLSSIPALRSIANDVVFDVLMYLTPEYCESILQVVTTQIIELYSTFQRINPSFIARGGKFSLVGHSLGSVILWDVLSILKDKEEKNIPKGNKNDPIMIDVPASPTRVHSLATLEKEAATMGNQAYAKGTENDSKHGTWGPCMRKKMLQTIPFTPDMTVFLGSPIGLFLSLRGAHPVFDEMRAIAEAERASLIPCDNEEAAAPPRVFDVSPIICSPFSLPTGALYNIFHPSDPVAYRIEPMLLPEGVDRDEFPAPLFLSPDGKSVRLHVKARQVGDQLFKQFGSLSSLFDKSVENAAAAAAAADAEAARKKAKAGGSNGKEKTPERPNFSGCIKDRECSFRLGGRSTRVDFQLQPGVIDNEYLSAVTAHSSYFSNEDIVDFIIFNTRSYDEKCVSTSVD